MHREATPEGRLRRAPMRNHLRCPSQRAAMDTNERSRRRHRAGAIAASRDSLSGAAYHLACHVRFRLIREARSGSGRVGRASCCSLRASRRNSSSVPPSRWSNRSSSTPSCTATGGRSGRATGDGSLRSCSPGAGGSASHRASRSEERRTSFCGSSSTHPTRRPRARWRSTSHGGWRPSGSSSTAACCTPEDSTVGRGATGSSPRRCASLACRVRSSSNCGQCCRTDSCETSP